MTTSTIVRPVQFLGSKLRSLDAILSCCSWEGVTAWDAFAGSSVVSQAMAGAGATVHATDMLESSICFSRALLGIGRPGGDVQLDSLVASVVDGTLRAPVGPWGDWLARERAALAAGDGSALLQISGALPQRWRLAEAGGELHQWLLACDARVGGIIDAPLSPTGVLTSSFAGTYFGLLQALQLEELRRQVDHHALVGWQRDVLMTALCSAASAAVFSAGKHFAQPHRVHSGKATKFHEGRILQDRRVDVVEHFERMVFRVANASTTRAAGQHSAALTPAEDVSGQSLIAAGVNVVYADPPYTAQQYSRFYHVLETIAVGQIPPLQLSQGAVTSGLYPPNRYRSAFCSRREAPGAFDRLVAAARASDALLIISYSATRTGGESGNARSVSLGQLVEIVGSHYGPSKTEVRDLDVSYRQFNNAGVAVAARSEPEVMILGSA